MHTQIAAQPTKRLTAANKPVSAFVWFCASSTAALTSSNENGMLVVVGSRVTSSATWRMFSRCLYAAFAALTVDAGTFFASGQWSAVPRVVSGVTVLAMTFVASDTAFERALFANASAALIAIAFFRSTSLLCFSSSRFRFFSASSAAFGSSDEDEDDDELEERFLFFLDDFDFFAFAAFFAAFFFAFLSFFAFFRLPRLLSLAESSSVGAASPSPSSIGTASPSTSAGGTEMALCPRFKV